MNDAISKKSIIVAGDICLDVVGIPFLPVDSGDETAENWRSKGEVRTYYLPGGALQLADFVSSANPDCEVIGPQPCKPASLYSGDSVGEAFLAGEFMKVASRFTRNEIVHSILSLEKFFNDKEKKAKETLRVSCTHGFSGPESLNSELKIKPAEGSADIVVLDDTGNRFRRSRDQWPSCILKPTAGAKPVIVHKLHRPLPVLAPSKQSKSVCPVGGEPSLWDLLKQHYPDQRLTIISIDDLRDYGAPISRGLSWERTALDLVWQLLNVDIFSELRDCSHLIVRFGLDGAVYWQKSPNNKLHTAWLIYDPTGIEGTAEKAYDGKMVGYSSVFTASLVKCLANAKAEPVATGGCNINLSQQSICEGIKLALIASRRLLQIGYGKNTNKPCLPDNELFMAPEKRDGFFACQPIPIIMHSLTPDRGYWRLLESIFQNNTDLLHRAVAMTAIGAKPSDPAGDDAKAEALLKQAPIAVFGKALRAYDRCEIENYRALYNLMFDYVSQPSPPRPLSVAVFGPPGAGKSFGVKMVAKALGEIDGARKIETLTFNLSQYKSSEQLADAFHLVRDLALRGKIPLVFFDEFDTALDDKALGWLRYFLAPMQDGEFLGGGVPHPIGQAIFVFAGGTCNTYEEFASPFNSNAGGDEKHNKEKREYFKSVKGPDFLSRLRGTLDIPGLSLDAKFDSYGPVEAFPCEAAILLRRAGILAHQLGEKAPQLKDASGKYRVSPSVLRALLHLPQFEHGNRSFEALLDMSHLPGSDKFTPALLPAIGHIWLHANATYLGQLLATDYPYPDDARVKIAQVIHEHYLKQRKAKGEYKPERESHQEWSKLSPRYITSNELQADDIMRKLRIIHLWFRKSKDDIATKQEPQPLSEEQIQTLAEMEHDRWVVSQRQMGYIYGPEEDKILYTHPCILRWNDERLSKEEKQKDLDAIAAIPHYLAAANYEIIDTRV